MVHITPQLKYIIFSHFSRLWLRSVQGKPMPLLFIYKTRLLLPLNGTSKVVTIKTKINEQLCKIKTFPCLAQVKVKFYLWTLGKVMYQEVSRYSYLEQYSRIADFQNSTWLQPSNPSTQVLQQLFLINVSSNYIDRLEMNATDRMQFNIFT